MAIQTGRILKIPYETKVIEWSIDDYFTVIQDARFPSYRSPTFSFAEGNATWYLSYYPRCFLTSKNEFVGLYLYRNVALEYQIEYTYGLRKRDGSMVTIFKGIIQKNSTTTRTGKDYDFIKKEELLRRKSELVPDNTLTIICSMKSMPEKACSPQDPVLDGIKTSKLTRLDKLSDSFKNLYADKETCDVTLMVQDKEYKAHRTVLMARSRVFAAAFKRNTLERMIGVIISDCDSDSFQKFLEYLYCGELDQLCFRSAISLYYTSDKYEFEELNEFCVEYLMQHLTVENICDIAVFADKYEEKKLFSKVQDFFNKNVRKILMTSEWESFLKNDHRLANKILIEMSNVRLGD